MAIIRGKLAQQKNNKMAPALTRKWQRHRTNFLVNTFTHEKGENEASIRILLV
jgi:hypothetical protein